MKEYEEDQPGKSTGKIQMTQLTGRVPDYVRNDFEQLKSENGYDTFSQFVEALLEAYRNPIKVNKDNFTRIKELEQELEDCKQAYNKAAHDVEILQEQNNTINTAYYDLEKQSADQSAKYDERLKYYQGLEHERDGHILVPVDDLDMRCLDYLANRENKKRHREDITPAVFFQYCIRELLIKGNKFAIDSVPDSVIEQFKKEINGK